MPQSWEGLPEKHMKKELESDMMPVLRLRCCYQEAQSLVCESGLRANAVLERDWRARWGLSTASSCWNKPRPGLQLAERALSEGRLEFEIGPIQELWAKRTTSKIHSPHTHTHIPLNTPAMPYPGKITICQHVDGLSLQRCREALVCGKPDTFLASLSAPRWPAAPPGNEALQGPAAAWHEWGAAAPHWGKRQGHPALPQHSTKAREQAVAAS